MFQISVRRLANYVLRRVLKIEVINHSNLRYAQDGLYCYHMPRFKGTPRFEKAYKAACIAAGGELPLHWRLHVVLWAARIALDVPGDFVECGVDRGFMTSAILQLEEPRIKVRDFFLFDTFSGVPYAQMSEDEKQLGRREYSEARYSVSYDEVCAHFASCPNVKIIQGQVPESLAAVQFSSIAFLHLDMNCALAEEEALRRMWPHIRRGGVVVLDDYCYRGFHPQGEMYDRLAKELDTEILALPTGQGLIFKTR